MLKSKKVQLVLWIVAFELISSLIGYLTQGQVDGWYASLEKPAFSPPNWLFPIAWTTLYALIAVAGFRIWHLPHGEKRAKLLRVFTVYMAMNWSWSFIFFTLHMLLAGFVWILLMIMLTVTLIVKLRHVDRLSSWFLVPLLLWTVFASYLNGMHWYLNG